MIGKPSHGRRGSFHRCWHGAGSDYRAHAHSDVRTRETCAEKTTAWKAVARPPIAHIAHLRARFTHWHGSPVPSRGGGLLFGARRRPFGSTSRGQDHCLEGSGTLTHLLLVVCMLFANQPIEFGLMCLSGMDVPRPSRPCRSTPGRSPERGLDCIRLDVVRTRTLPSSLQAKLADQLAYLLTCLLVYQEVIAA